jgi:hypothetical protein
MFLKCLLVEFRKQMAYQNSGSWPKNLLQKPLKSNEPGLPLGLARGGEPLVYFYKRTQRYLKAIHWNAKENMAFWSVLTRRILRH